MTDELGTGNVVKHSFGLKALEHLELSNFITSPSFTWYIQMPFACMQGILPEVTEHCINALVDMSKFLISNSLPCTSFLLSVPAEVLSDLPRNEDEDTRVEDCCRRHLNLSGPHWPGGLVAEGLW